MVDVPVEQILTGAVIPANAEYNRLFGEIAGNRSPATMEIKWIDVNKEDK